MREQFLMSGLSKTPNKQNANIIPIVMPTTSKQSLQSISKLQSYREEDQINITQSFISEFGKKSQDEKGFLTEKYEQLVKLKYEINKIQNKEISDAKKFYDKKVRFREFQRYLSKGKRNLDINQLESSTINTQSIHDSLDQMERINSVYQKKYEFDDQYYKKKQKENFDNKYYSKKKEQLQTIDSSPDKLIEQKLFFQKQASLQKQDEQMLINQVYQETFSPDYLEKKTRIPKEELEPYFQKNIKNNPEAIFQPVAIKQDKLPPIIQQKLQSHLFESRQTSIGQLNDNSSSDDSLTKLTINQRRKATMKNIKLQLKQQSTLVRSPQRIEDQTSGSVKRKTITRSPIRRKDTTHVVKETEKPPSAPKIKSLDEILDFSKMTTAQMLALFMLKREELLRKQALKHERQRDRYFKKCNNLKDRNKIQTDSSIQRDQNFNSSIDHRFSSPDLSLNRTIRSSEDDQNNQTEFIKIIEKEDQFIKIRLNQEWDFQYDRNEALEFSHKDLPLDFLAAQLSFTNEERDYWQTYLEVNEIKEQLRRSTGFQFDKADIYNDSCGSFNEYLKSEMPVKDKTTPRGLNKIVSDFQKKADFLKSIKFENKIQTRELSDSKQLHLKFAEVSSKLLATPLPILLKIKNGMLCIPSSYSISQGNARALGESFAALDTFLDKEKKEIEMISANESGESEEEGVGAMKLYKLILDRNKMRDEDFESILFGLRHRSEFQSLTTILNTIGSKSANELVKLITRERVNDNDPTFQVPQITELRIENCMTDPKAMDSIINAISQTQINRLSFSKMKLLDIQLKGIISFVAESSNLIELDLSWNKIINKSLASLFTALSTNQTIQILNLGWVSMESSNEVLDKYFPKFCEFVKTNSRLTHLDLTSINLPQKHFQMLIQDIKRSVSLHCVHFCGNRFDEKTQEILLKKLKPTYINQMTLDEKREQHDSFKHDLLTRIQQGVETLANREKHLRIYDSVQVKQINNEWQQVRKDYQHSTKDDPFFVPMILSKVLGHSEIRNGKHWKVTNECYMCDKWKYSFIFWDLTNQGFVRQIKNPILEQELAEMIRNSNQKFKNLQEQNLLVPAGQINPGEEGARAFIAGSFTDWQPRRMLLIDELIAYLEKKEEVLYNKDRREAYSDKVKRNWRNKLFDLSAYGSKADGGTQFINDPDIDDFGSRNPPELTFNQLFVYIDFIKPGKHSYIVSYQNLVEEPRPQIPVSSPVSPNRRGSYIDYSESEDENFQKRVQQERQNQQKLLEQAQNFVPHKSQVRLTSYHEFIGQAHLDDYNINVKSNEFDAVDRNFDRNKSVFKDWKLDNEKQVQNGLVEEIQYWAVPNIVKEESEQLEIQKILQEHAIFLKTVFIVQSSASYFPLIRYLYFGDMIRDWHIFNDKFGKLEVDNIFLRITKNMPADLVGKMPEKDMSRFQFYESLVRIAFVRYKSQGITNNTAEGLKMLIEQVLLPKYQSESYHPQKFDNAIWQEWRENKLWTLEIDDLYKANLKAMKKIYEFYFIVKKTKTLFIGDAIEIFTKEIQLDLLPEQIMAAWGLSHMSVMNDIRQRERYNAVVFVEFLEFFARVAALKYKEGPNKNQQLVEKIELLMDIVFPIVSAKRKIVNIEQAYVSVSEEELDEEKYFVPKK